MNRLRQKGDWSSLYDNALANKIRQVRCPVLLVHGLEDTTVPVSEAYTIHTNRSGDQVQLKIVAGSHDDYPDLDKELPVLVGFLTENDAFERIS